MYCLKFCAGSVDAQHNLRSDCGDKYVWVQGAIQNVLFPSLGLKYVIVTLDILDVPLQMIDF
jgi:hypothetical protein